MISVAMITLNEEKAVEAVIRDVLRAVPDAEIVIVDSSEDRTPEIAESLGAKVIRQYPPQGYGVAMEKALRSAAGEVVVTMDCDGTYPAEMIPKFVLEVTDGGYDLVDGSRLKGKPAAMPWVNYIANRFFALIASALFCVRLTDLHSGMRAYRKEMVEGIPFRAEGAAFPVELLLLPLKKGYRVKTIFIPYRERIGESTMRPLESALWTIRRILRVRFGTQKNAC